jgi:hypothetical protein
VEPGGSLRLVAADVKNDRVRYTSFSGSQCYGTSVFTTVKMQGWRTREARCTGGRIVKSNLPCDLDDTQATLASYETEAERAARSSIIAPTAPSPPTPARSSLPR